MLATITTSFPFFLFETSGCL